MSETRVAERWDHEFDVVVVGSGAGGMIAAVTARDLGQTVVVLEKSDLYGGTTAISGGGIWVPCNHLMNAAGGSDTYDEAITYLKAATRGMVAEARLHAYLEHSPRMLHYLEEKTPLRYRSMTYYSDYYPNLPGAKPGGRTLDPLPFDARRLGNEYFRMRPPQPGTLIGGRVTMTAGEARVILCKEPGWMMLLARRMASYWLDLRWRRRSKRDRRLTLGSSLIASLRRSMLDRDIPLWLDTAFDSLISDGRRIAGVIASQKGGTIRIGAKRGIVLAAGGFEHNQEMREQYLPKPTRSEWTVTPPANTGDAIRAGKQAGAQLALMDLAWWAPTVFIAGKEKRRALFVERALPGCVMVNRLGRRFVDEAAPYQDIVSAMYADNEKTGANLPAWLVFDADFRRKYPCGPLLPGQVRPDSSLRKDWEGTVYVKADSLELLAHRIEVDAKGLAETIQRMNGYAAGGDDAEFGKGSNDFDRYYGDRHVKPNPCLAPIGKAPFYAMRIDAGDIGTKGGLLTDEYARVLREDGQPIPGLYATGNTSAAVMGPSYPGAGSTIGPAMTFGYIAAHHLAGV
ncbi:MAG TPA: FAD-dependent oxidoreductase [Candidatus Binataceae bacterium]